MDTEINTLYLYKKLFLLFILSISLFSIIATANCIYNLKNSSLNNNVEHNRCTFYIILSLLSIWLTNGTVHDLKESYNI